MPRRRIGNTTITYGASRREVAGPPDDVTVVVGDHLAPLQGEHHPLDRRFVSIERVNRQDPEDFVAELTDEELRDELLSQVREQHLTFHTAREFEAFLGLLIAAGYRAYGAESVGNAMTQGVVQAYVETALEALVS